MHSMLPKTAYCIDTTRPAHSIVHGCEPVTTASRAFLHCTWAHAFNCRHCDSFFRLIQSNFVQPTVSKKWSFTCPSVRSEDNGTTTYDIRHTSSSRSKPRSTLTYFIDERTNERASERTNRRTNERTNQPTTNEPTNQRTNEPTNRRPTNQRTNEPTNRRPTNQQTDEPTNQRTNEPTNRRPTNDERRTTNDNVTARCVAVTVAVWL